MTNAVQLDVVEARIRDVEESIEKLNVRLKPDTPRAQRVPLERMIAKKQTMLRELRRRHGVPAQAG
ncbi:MAG: hypothetical protein ACT4QF_03630 [Sporichthyaceae bacterium]